jgi:hypothetical protein
VTGARTLLVLAAAVLIGCGPAPPPVQTTTTGGSDEPWYGPAVEQLTSLNRDAERAFQAGKFDEASALILKGEPLANRVVAVPRPTLAAMEAASDLDQLYGRMLLMNRNYGWARLEFQKNRARWKTWQPQTPETARRLKLAEDGIAECDKGIEQ